MGQAHDFEDIYKDLGINLNTLGCIMLDVEGVDSSDLIEDEDLYYTKNKERFWINGRVGGSHVTLRYGLLPGVKRKHVDAVLSNLTLPTSIEVNEKLYTFPSPYRDDRYECIVAHVKSPEVFAFNSELGLLPNVNTFTQYLPHVTVAYVREGWYNENVGRVLTKTVLKVTGLNYGKEIK
jgi:hypothetical protein